MFLRNLLKTEGAWGRHTFLSPPPPSFLGVEFLKSLKHEFTRFSYATKMSNCKILFLYVYEIWWFLKILNLSICPRCPFKYRILKNALLSRIRLKFQNIMSTRSGWKMSNKIFLPHMQTESETNLQIWGHRYLRGAPYTETNDYD